MVSPDPIQLAIYSPHVPNLTMVDMPGALLLLLYSLTVRSEPGSPAWMDTWNILCCMYPQQIAGCGFLLLQLCKALRAL
jgi:hypothetical protein